MTPSIEIIIDPEFPGPTILELRSFSTDVIKVRWTNTKPEFYLLQKLKRNHKFRLYVADLCAQERASSFLGQSLKVESNVIETGKLSLNSSGWREYANGLGAAVTRGVMTRIAADNLRKGKAIRFASVARDCLLNGVNPLDADVLFRLRNL